MKVLGSAVATLLLLLGVVFCVAAAASGLWARWILGGILLGAGVAVMYVTRMKAPETRVTVTQKIDLSGDVALEELTCAQCGGTLDSTSVSVRAGAVFVTCPFCSAEYQIEEEPKW